MVRHGAPAGEVRDRAQTDGGCALDAELVIAPGQLAVHYRVSNRSGELLLVEDVLAAVVAGRGLCQDRHLGYVSFEDPDTLALKRVTPRPTATIPALSEPHQYARLLKPAASLAGVVVVALPAREYNPYYPASKTSVYRKAAARRLRLVLEYRCAAPGAEARFVEAIWILATPVPVKRRSDFFEPV